MNRCKDGDVSIQPSIYSSIHPYPSIYSCIYIHPSIYAYIHPSVASPPSCRVSSVGTWLVGPNHHIIINIKSDDRDDDNGSDDNSDGDDSNDNGMINASITLLLLL